MRLLLVVWLFYSATLLSAEGVAPNLLHKITVQPDKAPNCTSLKTMVETVTRDCKNNDAKAVAIYNFMQLTHYHRDYPNEDGGVPVLKEINNYGWSLCGGLHSEQSALWRQLGWGWRFVGWDGHTTVEAQYDGHWHYLDIFLKFYAWMPDGKGGRTIAGEDDLTSRSKELITDAFTLDKSRNIVYQNNNPYAMVSATQSNWRAPSFLSCGDTLEGTIGGLKTHHGAGSPEGWAGINHADGNYKTDVDLAPGFALTNSWDPVPDGWYWRNAKIAPAHTCGGHKDTRNDPGIGLVLEPYFNACPSRCYGNGTLSFAPDFSGDALLSSFVSTDNVKYADKTLSPKESDKPGMVVFRLASPYVMTKASGEATGAEKIELSVDEGKTYAAIDAKDFSAAVKGKLAAWVKVTFKDALKGLKFEATVQNNPGSLPYLSPGKNKITVAAADPDSLGNNKLVVTYAYRLGSRSKSFEQLCEQGKEIAKQHNATCAEAVTCVQKTFTAKDLPASFEIDCPTPKGQYPVYPRMIFVRREVIGADSKPLPLPTGAIEAKLNDGDELVELPNPFLVGTEEPPEIKPRPTKTVEIPLKYVQFVDEKGAIADTGMLRWPKDDKEKEKVVPNLIVLGGEVVDLPKNIATARVYIPIISGHASAAGQLGVVFLKAPVEKGAAVDFKGMPEPAGMTIVPKQPKDTLAYSPAKVIPIDVTRNLRSIAAGETKFNGLALRMIPNRAVDDGYTVRCEISNSEKIVLKVDVYTDQE